MDTRARRRGLKSILFFGLVLVLGTIPSAIAQWSTDPSVNTPVCVATGDQASPVVVSDGGGGAIIAWEDFRGGSNPNVYAQRFDASGYAKWSSNGIPLWIQSAAQNGVRIITDGAGGAIVLWKDFRGGDTTIYAQRLNPAGVTQWTSSGVPVVLLRSGASFDVGSDDAGGAFIAWEDYRNGNADIYAQRISSGGLAMWPSGGVAICTEGSKQSYPRLITAVDGSAIIAWNDARGPSVYANRITFNGTIRWATDGINTAIPPFEYTDPGFQLAHTIASDGRGGVIVVGLSGALLDSQTWYFEQGQRLDSLGAPQWGIQGITIDSSGALGGATPPQCFTDDAQGALLLYWDYSLMGLSAFHVSRVDNSGSVVWRLQSGYIAGLGGNGSSGGLGDLLLATGSYSVFTTLRRVANDGTTTWSSFLTTDQPYPVSVIGDGSGGAIAVWSFDRNNGTGLDLYAQHITAEGALPMQLASFRAAVVGERQITLDWSTVSEVDNYGFQVQRGQASTGPFVAVANGFVPGHGNTIVPQHYSFTDTKVPVGTWYYRLKQIDRDGSIHYSEPVSVLISDAPTAYSLAQNYPNPFNPSTTIRYELPKSSMVRLSVYDILGREVSVLVNERKNVGSYEVKFDGKNLATGVYFYRLQAGDFTQTKRLLLLK